VSLDRRPPILILACRFGLYVFNLLIGVFYFGITIVAAAQHFDRAKIAYYEYQDSAATLRKKAGTPIPQETLNVLGTVDPNGYTYVEQGRIEASILPADLFAQRLGKKYRHTMALTATPRDGLPVVFLNGGILDSPALQAVALAHEIIHARHADPHDLMSHHAAWRHLWITEEGEAHLRQLRLSQALHLPLQKPLSPAWMEYVIMIVPIPLWMLCTIAYFAGWAWTRSDGELLRPYLRSELIPTSLLMIVFGTVSSAFLPSEPRLSLMVEPFPTAICVFGACVLLGGFVLFNEFPGLRRAMGRNG
jgi:hypothetical protein